MQCFQVRLINQTFYEIKADFLTSDIFLGGLRGTVRFWIKAPHWYGRRRCVGILDWATAFSVGTVESAAETAHELGIQL
jgi:hypothetical protein